MSIFRFLFKKNPSTVTFTGALLDTRSDAEKQNDIHFSEIVGMAAAVNWNKTTYRTFEDLDQEYSNECGAFSGRKYLGILYSLYAKYGKYIDFSHSHIYQRRINRPDPGMTFPDLLAILGQGTTLIPLTNEVTHTDNDSDSLVIPQWMKTIGEQFATGTPVYVNPDFDTIASVIQTTGKPVIALGYFLSSEWSSLYPTVQNKLLGYNDPSALHHFYVITDYVTLNGVQYLVIEDSAHFGGYTRRFVTRDWVTRRIIICGYTMNFKFAQESGSKPTYDGSSIISAQTCLQWLGYFPLNVNKAETIGPTTKAALAKFQTTYALPVTSAIDKPTQNELRQLFP